MTKSTSLPLGLNTKSYRKHLRDKWSFLRDSPAPEEIRSNHNILCSGCPKPIPMQSTGNSQAKACSVASKSLRRRTMLGRRAAHSVDAAAPGGRMTQLQKSANALHRT